MSEIWDRFVNVLVAAWHWAHDWYALVVLGAALFGVVVVVIEVRELKRARRSRG